VSKDGVDALVAGGYKGLLGPFGAAIFYLRRELIPEFTPPLAGWRSTETPYDLDVTQLAFARDAKKFEYSTMSYASAVGLAESMRYLNRIGWKAVTEHVLSLTKTFIDMTLRNRRLPEATTLTPEGESRRASIASFTFKGRDQSAVAAELAKRGVIVSQRFNGVRFSFHVYNTEEDLLQAKQALEETLA
jgi:cysteine desulfurase/selenocysteine lyase